MFAKLKVKFFPGSIIKRFKSDFARRVFLLKQYEGTVKRVWGLEFAIKGLKEGREVLRREYDKLTEDTDAAMVALANTESQEAKQALEKAIEVKKREIEEWKQKIDLADESLEQVETQIDGYRDNLDKLEQEIYNV